MSTFSKLANKPWCLSMLSSHPRITFPIIQSNDLPWDWRMVSTNPNITF